MLPLTGYQLSSSQPYESSTFSEQALTGQVPAKRQSLSALRVSTVNSIVVSTPKKRGRNVCVADSKKTSAHPQKQWQLQKWCYTPRDMRPEKNA